MKKPICIAVASTLAVLVAWPLAASAQPAAPTPEPTRRFRLDAGALVGFAQGDWENVSPSPGVRLGFGYAFTPNLSLGASARYISVRPDEDVDTGGVDASQLDLAAGARYTAPVSPAMSVFAEGELNRSTVTFSGGGDSLDGDGIGFGVGGGALFKLGDSLGLYGGFHYTIVSVDFDIPGTEKVDANWLTIDAGVSISL